METIFKAAMNHIRANEDLKKKTREYLIANSGKTSAVNRVATRSLVMKRVLAAACAVVFVCAMSVGAAVYYKTPASYLSLDINPSVELGVNAFGKIVTATAYNSDGMTILNGQNLMDIDVKSAVHTLVKAAAQKGFVAKDGSTVISVTSETDDSATAAALEDAAAQGAVAAIKSEGKTATINKDTVPLEKRSEAQKLDITPGKLNLIRKLQALDASITVDEYKDVKVTDIMKKLIELRKSTGADGDDTDSSPSPADKDSQDASGETVNDHSQVTSGETADENSPNSSGEPVNENSPDSSISSDDPVNEDSHAASSEKGETSSRAQSHTGQKANSHTSSLTSSQPQHNTVEDAG